MSKPQNLSFRTATARLLATENITVNQTNSQTAWFDVEKRILNLPMWDVEDYVYDMLVGHEVGHALYTPTDGWHDSITDLGIPRSYINVVEDARIEKLVKRQYPGIVHTFSRAYAWMHTNDFFKIGGRDLFQMNLIDRINCHFKLGQSMYVPFTDDEKPFIKMVEDCESFEEVIDTCKAIMDFWKDNKDDIQKALEDLSVTDSDEDAEFESGQGGDVEDGDVADEDDSDTDEGMRYAKQETSKEYSDSNGDSDSTDSTDTNEDEALTDIAQRSNESTLLKDSEGTIVKFFPRSFLKHIVVPSSDYHASPRNAISRRNQYRAWVDYRVDKFVDGQLEISYEEFCSTILFKKFLNDTNRVVSYLAKEFDQKKAAYQYSRAKVSTSGVLNTSALHKYKFSEDVFKRTMSLADAKSHGMIISVDMSGSMSDVMYDTVVQALNLAMFCRRVGIPFEMYTFTAGSSHRRSSPEHQESMDSISALGGTVMPYGVEINQLFSSRMTKKQFDDAVKSSYMLACGVYNEYDGMGSTPTNETLMCLRYIIEDFQSRHRVQKLINVVLTDGDPNRVHVASTNHDMYNSRYRGTLQVSGTKFIKIDNMDSDLSAKLLTYLRNEYKVINLGYFLGDNSTMRRAMYACSESAGFNISQEKIRSELRKNGSYSQENVSGYDQYFLIKSTKFGVQDNEFAVEGNASKKELAKEFSKFAKGRRQSRVLLDKFVKIVA